MCGAVEFFDPPFCCIACGEEWYKKLDAKMKGDVKL
jgi:hypothetical protein